jgi:hypothetical protein
MSPSPEPVDLRWLSMVARSSRLSGLSILAFQDFPDLEKYEDFVSASVSRATGSNSTSKRNIKPHRLRHSMTLLAALTSLHRWTCNRTVRAKHTTIPQLRFQAFTATLAIIKELAGACGHCFLGLITAFRTSDDRIQNHAGFLRTQSFGPKHLGGMGSVLLAPGREGRPVLGT